MSLVNSLQSLFSKQLADQALARIASGVKLVWRDVSPMWWTRQDAELLAFLLSGGYIDREELEAAISKGISSYGWDLYVQCGAQEVFPDDPCILSEHAIAFAITTGAVSKQETESLRFDHDETMAEFLRKADGLLERVTSQLLLGMSHSFGVGGGSMDG
jgi:hypothetical protein